MTQRETAGYFPWLAGMFIIAGIVHIVSVLAMPALATRDAFARLSATTPVNALALLPDAGPGREIIPFDDAQTAVAICRFDLAADRCGCGPQWPETACCRSPSTASMARSSTP